MRHANILRVVSLTGSAKMINIYAVILCLGLICFDVTFSRFGPKWDFSVVVTSKSYVDKTLFIKEFLREDENGVQVQVMTAPSRFGKSTIKDMVKRFIAPATTTSGQTEDGQLNENYHLFCKRPFEICSDPNYVQAHLGQYPVIDVDLALLRRPDSYGEFLDAFRLIVRDAFAEHRYLAQNTSLFDNASERVLFIKYCSDFGVKFLNETHLRTPFKWLSRLLYNKFRKKVVVLMDDFDAYPRGRLLRTGNYSEEIIEFLSDMSEDLFLNNDYLDKAMLTGVIYAKGTGVPSVSTDVRLFRFLGDHKFARYFGFTGMEVEQLTRRYVFGIPNIDRTRTDLARHFDGYSIENRTTASKLYPLWSVVKYFENNMTVGDYWSAEQNIEGLIGVFGLSVAMNVTQELVFKGELYGDMCRPLTKEILCDIKEERFDHDTEIRWFTVLLYEFGFLTVSPKPSTKKPLLPLVIPNTEIYHHFGGVLSRVHHMKYKLERLTFTPFQYALDELSPNTTNITQYRNLYNATRRLIDTKRFRPRSEMDFQALFLILLLEDFRVIRPISYEVLSRLDEGNHRESNIETSPLMKTAMKDEFEKADLENRAKMRNKLKGKMEVLAINSLGTMFSIETKRWVPDPNEKENTLDEVAKQALEMLLICYGTQLPESSSEKSENFYNFKGQQFIGVGYDVESRNLSMAFHCSESNEDPVVINSL